MKQKPPIDDKLIEFRFPTVKETVLKNGLTVMVIEQPKIPKVYYRVGIQVGEKHDPPGKEGTLDLLSLLIKKGTQRRSYEEIVEQVDFMGGELDAVSRRDFFYLFGEFLQEYAAQGLEIVADVLMNPVFPPEELEKEKAKMLADLENEKSSPAFLANRKFNEVLFQPHPYARYKTPESLQAIDRQTIQEMHDRYIRPNNSYLVIAGAVTFEEAVQLAREYLEGWDQKPLPADTAPEPQPPKRRTVFLIDRPDSEQSNILLGNVLFNRKHPDYEKAVVMNKILGGGASGRLFMYLREEKGYTYGAYSSIRTYKDHGAFSANAEVRTEVTREATDGFFEQFRAMREAPVSEEDLKNAKRYLIGVFPLQNETPSSIASLAMQQKLYDLPDDYWNQYLKAIDAVTREDVQNIARTYLRDEEMAVVVVGDAGKIKDSLTAFGPVKVFDVDNNPVE